MLDLDKEWFVCGCDDKASGYRQIHHLGEYTEVKKTYESMCSGASLAGLNKDALFLLPFPPDDEVVETCKLTRSFLQWLNEESQPIIKKIIYG